MDGFELPVFSEALHAAIEQTDTIGEMFEQACRHHVCMCMCVCIHHAHAHAACMRDVGAQWVRAVPVQCAHAAVLEQCAHAAVCMHRRAHHAVHLSAIHPTLLYRTRVLQHLALGTVALCSRGCNPTCARLQPYVPGV